MEEALIKRIMPNNQEAEQSVIGSMIMDKDAIVTAMEMLSQEDFYYQQYGMLFVAMTELYNAGGTVDLITLQDKLKVMNVPPEISSLEFVRDLLTGVQTSANIKAYAKIVKDKSILRRLIKVTEEIENQCYTGQKELEEILQKRGIRYGTHDFTIADASTLVINNKNKATIIRKLLEADLGEEVWNQLTQNNPDIATRLAAAKLHEDRIISLRTFEQMLSDEKLTENDWQNFFEENIWIFGYGLRYQILRLIQAQPNYGGATVSGMGGQRGDFLTATEAETKFTCLRVCLKNAAYPIGGSFAL